MRNRSLFYRQSLAIFVAIGLFLLVAFTLEKTGITRGYTVALAACSLLALWIVTVLPGSTTTASTFFFAEKSVRSTVNALAMMTCLSFPIFLGDSGGLFFSNPSFLIVIVIAVSVGIALSSLLASRQFQQSRAISVAYLLIHRFQSPLAARCIAVASTLSAFFLAVCGISIVFSTLIWFFEISEFFALFITVLAIGLTVILGGANTNTRLAAISAVLLLSALNLPLLLNAISYSNFPFGHFSFGSDALVEMWDLEDQLASLQIPKLADVMTPISPLLNWTGGQQVAAGIVIVGAIVFYPALVQQFGIAASSSEAAAASQKTILYCGLAGASLAALLAFTQFGLYQTVLGLSVSEARVAAPFLFSWGERSAELVTVCGNALSSNAQLLNACPDGADHVMSVQDLSLDARLLLLGAADLTALPFAYTAFMTSAVLMSAISFTSMIILATANNIVSAFYGTSTSIVASARVFFARGTAIIFVIICAAYVNYYEFDPTALFFLAMSILASTLVPAMIGALYIPQANSAHVVTAIAIGFTVAILYFVLSKFGIDFTRETNDELRIILPGMVAPIPSELSAIFAVPFSLISLLAGVVLSAYLSPANDALSAEGD